MYRLLLLLSRCVQLWAQQRPKEKESNDEFQKNQVSYGDVFYTLFPGFVLRGVGWRSYKLGLANRLKQMLII